MHPNQTPALPVEELDPVDGEAAPSNERIPLTGGTSDIPQVIEPEQYAADQRDWRLINAQLVSLLYDAGLDAEKFRFVHNIPDHLYLLIERADEWFYLHGVEVEDVLVFENLTGKNQLAFVEVEFDGDHLPSELCDLEREGGVIIDDVRPGTATVYLSQSHDWAETVESARPTVEA